MGRKKASQKSARRPSATADDTKATSPENSKIHSPKFSKSRHANPKTSASSRLIGVLRVIVALVFAASIGIYLTSHEIWPFAPAAPFGSGKAAPKEAPRESAKKEEAVSPKDTLEDLKHAFKDGQALHKKGDLKGALRAFTLAAGMAEADPERLGGKFDASYELGRVHMDLGDCESAVGSFHRSLASFPWQYFSRVKLGNCLAYLGDRTRLGEYYSGLLESAAPTSPADLARGAYLSLLGGDLGGARDRADGSLQASTVWMGNPNTAKPSFHARALALWVQGRAAERGGNFTEAQRAFGAARATMGGGEAKRAYEELAWHNYLHWGPWLTVGDKGQQAAAMDHLAERLGEDTTVHFPRTFLMPSGAAALKDHHAKLNASGAFPVWIAKPTQGANAEGLHITPRLSDLPKSAGWVVQRYIDKPFLIDGRKFKLRVYAVMPSAEPMRIYLCTEGFAYFSVEQWKDGHEHLHDEGVQISGGKAKDFITVPPWTLAQVGSYVDNQPGWTWSGLWEQISEATARTFASIEGPLAKHAGGFFGGTGAAGSFTPAIFGLDFQIDERGNVWLIEVNPGGGLLTASTLKLGVLQPLVLDAWRLATPRRVLQNPLAVRYGAPADAHLEGVAHVLRAKGHHVADLDSGTCEPAPAGATGTCWTAEEVALLAAAVAETARAEGGSLVRVLPEPSMPPPKRSVAWSARLYETPLGARIARGIHIVEPAMLERRP